MSETKETRSLDDAFIDIIRNALTPEKVLPVLIARSLSARGITLTPANMEDLRNSIRDVPLGVDSFTVPVDETVNPTFTPEELARHAQEVADALGANVDKFGRRLGGYIAHAMNEVAREVAPEIVTHIRKRRSRVLRRLRRERLDFQDAVQSHWRLGLDALECEIEVAIETWFACDSRGSAEDRGGRRIKQAVGSLHSRGCQIANEVLVLLRNGYADGAHARWRSLHEVATVAWFIHSAGERTALRFIEHAVVNQAKQLRSELSAWPARKSDRHFNKVFQAATVEVNKLKKKYGAAYAGDYGWAEMNLKSGKDKGPTFLDIEKHVGMDFLRPHYGLANLSVHASALSMSFRLSLGPLDGAYVAMAGASPYGLGDPGSLTARSLLFLTLPLLNAFPSVDGVVTAKVFDLLAADAIKRFEGATKRTSTFDPQPVELG